MVVPGVDLKLRNVLHFNIPSISLKLHFESKLNVLNPRRLKTVRLKLDSVHLQLLLDPNCFNSESPAVQNNPTDQPTCLMIICPDKIHPEFPKLDNP